MRYLAIVDEHYSYFVAIFMATTGTLIFSASKDNFVGWTAFKSFLKSCWFPYIVPTVSKCKEMLHGCQSCYRMGCAFSYISHIVGLELYLVNGNASWAIWLDHSKRHQCYCLALATWNLIFCSIENILISQVSLLAVEPFGKIKQSYMWSVTLATHSVLAHKQQ